MKFSLELLDYATLAVKRTDAWFKVNVVTLSAHAPPKDPKIDHLSARGGRDDPRYVIVRQSGRPHSAETLGQASGAKKESETGGATTHEGAMLK